MSLPPVPPVHPVPSSPTVENKKTLSKAIVLLTTTLALTLVATAQDNKEGGSNQRPSGPTVESGNIIAEPYLKIKDDQATSLQIEILNGSGGTPKSNLKKLNRRDGLWEIKIEDLKLSPGIYDYKVVRDEVPEPGAPRVLNIVEKEMHVRLDPKRSEIVIPSNPSSLLVVRDPNVNYLAIRYEVDGKKKEAPLKPIVSNVLDVGKYISAKGPDRRLLRFKAREVPLMVEVRTTNDNWKTGFELLPNENNPEVLELDIEKLKLPKGRHEFKFVINGDFEPGNNRVLWIAEDGLMAEEQPEQRDRSILWTIDTKKLGLPTGVTDYSLVTNRGQVVLGNRTLEIDEAGDIIYPLPRNPIIINQAKAGNKIEVISPNQTNIGIRHSGDKWAYTHPMRKTGNTYSITQKDLKLPPGDYKFKIMVGEEFESGNDRKMTITKDGQILLINKEDMGVPNEKAEIKINAPKARTVEMRHSADWGRVNEFTQSPSGEWVLDWRNLGITKDQRIFFYLIINGKNEEGPLRSGHVNDEGEFVIEKKSSNESTLADPNLLVNQDPYFGNTLKIDPNPVLSLKGEDGWYNSARVYHLWVPSFRDSQSGPLAKDEIGDIPGITEAVKSGYFSNLGINALWLSPIFESGDEDDDFEKMHGYETRNFYRVNKNFGTIKDVQSLLEEAHKKNIRIILEFVPNHVGKDHPWFLASKNPNDPLHEKFKDWFVWLDEPVEGFGLRYWHKEPLWTKAGDQYYYHIFSPALPDLNYRNTEVVQEMANVAIYWLNMGVDGFRVDANKYLFEDFENKESGAHNQPETIEFYQELKRLLNSYARLGYAKTIIAENWTYSKEEVEVYGDTDGKDGFDLSLDFVFPRVIKDTAVEESPEAVLNYIENELPNNIKYLRFLTNHDLSAPRSKTNFKDTRKLASTLNMLLPGPYIVYYGEEIDMEGDTFEGVRNKFEWDRVEKAKKGSTQEFSKTLSHYQTLGQLRQKYSKFFDSDMSEVVSSEDGTKIIVNYKKDNEQLLVIINTSNNDQETSISLPPNVEVEDVLSKETINSNNESAINVDLSPYGIRALVISEK